MKALSPGFVTLPFCPGGGLGSPGHGIRTATGPIRFTHSLGGDHLQSRVRSRSSGHREAQLDRSRSHGSRYRSRDRHRSRDRLPLSSDRLQSRKRIWQPGQSCWDRVEVSASQDRGNSGSRVEPAPVVVGGSAPLPTPNLQDLARLFLSLLEPFAQRDAVGASLFLAAGVTSTRALPGPAASVMS